MCGEHEYAAVEDDDCLGLITSALAAHSDTDFREEFASMMGEVAEATRLDAAEDAHASDFVATTAIVEAMTTDDPILVAHSAAIHPNYTVKPNVFWVASDPPQELGRVDAIRGMYLKATCKRHSSAAVGKGKKQICAMWFQCDWMFKDAEHACHVWLVRGHSQPDLDSMEAHMNEGKKVRAMLEPKWKEARRVAEMSAPKAPKGLSGAASSSTA